MKQLTTECEILFLKRYSVPIDERESVPIDERESVPIDERELILRNGFSFWIEIWFLEIDS